jgi:hypothetical protein
VQQLMHASVDRKERDLIDMRIAERDHADAISLAQNGHARQGPAHIPVHGNVVGQDEVDDATAQPDEDRPIAGAAAVIEMKSRRVIPSFKPYCVRLEIVRIFAAISGTSGRRGCMDGAARQSSCGC